MVRAQLIRTFLLAAALLAEGCTRAKVEPKDRGSPAPSSSTPSAPRDRAEERPGRDPSFPAPPGYRRMAVGGVAPLPQGGAVVLVDGHGKRGLILFIGGSEALAISLRLQHENYERPLTHDLMDSALAQLGGTVVSASVDRIEHDTYFGSVVIRKGTRKIELDARPSDAIALALGSSAPLFVADRVLEQAGIDTDSDDFRKLYAGSSDKGEEKHEKTSGEIEL